MTRALAVILAFISASGCANLVYEDPTSGLGATAQLTFASAAEKVVGRIDMSRVAGHRVYVAGWADFSRARRRTSYEPRVARDLRHARSGEAARRAEAAYIANAVAARVVDQTGEPTSERAAADLWLVPWIQVAGGSTTHREYRMYQYPIYIDEEDYRVVWLELLLFEPGTGRLYDLIGERSWTLHVDSWILDIFGIRFGS